MRLARVAFDGQIRFAALEGGRVELLEGSFDEGFRPTGTGRPLAEVRLLAPVVPGKIVAVGSNYPRHAAEMGREVPDEPKIFLKPPSAVVGPDEAILIPPRTTRVDPEGELAVVVGRRLSRAAPRDTLGAVFGYTILNDVTCRDFQKKDGVFARAKGFDTFCPLGPWIVTDLDPSDLLVRTAVNGEVRAEGRTSEMFFDVPTLLAFVSQVMTLEPGDVVSTGTPPGVAPIVHGDRVEVTIEGIGVLASPVRDRDDRVA